MLPENTQLRSDNSTLNQFLEAAQQVEPEFQPGTDSRYSSVGFLLLGAAIETITGTPLDRYLHDTFFEPLGMGSTWLGLPQDAADQLLPTVMPCELPAWQTEARHWDWNSRYWRTLGAPWGGLISTASDLGCFAREILTSLRSTGQSRCVNSAAARSAILDQTQHYTSIPQAVRQARPWGLGWRRQWPAHAASFGDLVSSETVGHWGATGTVMWFDPVADRYCVILSTTPYEISCSTIQRLSNVVAASS
jgi:CubicO group peptidase (beta-lactamase class C family)